MNRLISILVIGLFATMAAAGDAASNDADDAAKKTASRNECVFFSTVYDWRGLDDSNLIVWAPNKRDAYHVQLTMPLIGLRFANTLAFIDGNDDRMLCSFGRDAIGTDEGGVPGKSSIRSMSRVDKEELASLGEKYKVNLSRDKKQRPPEAPRREQAQ